MLSLIASAVVWLFRVCVCMYKSSHTVTDNTFFSWRMLVRGFMHGQVFLKIHEDTNTHKDGDRCLLWVIPEHVREVLKQSWWARARGTQAQWHTFLWNYLDIINIIFNIGLILTWQTASKISDLLFRTLRKHKTESMVCQMLWLVWHALRHRPVSLFGASHGDQVKAESYLSCGHTLVQDTEQIYGTMSVNPT